LEETVTTVARLTHIKAQASIKLAITTMDVDLWIISALLSSYRFKQTINGKAFLC